MKKIRVTQIKSGINRPEPQKRTIRALGITKMYQTVELEVSPQVLGMIDKVRHLVKIEEL